MCLTLQSQSFCLFLFATMIQAYTVLESLAQDQEQAIISNITPLLEHMMDMDSRLGCGL